MYLKTDVLLLCDVFEKFINICIEYYELDPCHYFSIPGLAWDLMLKMTGIKLRLIDDIEKHLFIEKGMRGGVSCITRRYCKANNKYVKDYDKDKENTYITYWDVNNLYGWAMSQYLPYDNFEWMNEEEINENDIYEKIFEDKYLFDFSDYSKESKFYDDSNKKVIGKMRDEMRGNATKLFLSLLA